MASFEACWAGHFVLDAEAEHRGEQLLRGGHGDPHLGIVAVGPSTAQVVTERLLDLGEVVRAEDLRHAGGGMDDAADLVTTSLDDGTVYLLVSDRSRRGRDQAAGEHAVTARFEGAIQVQAEVVDAAEHDKASEPSTPGDRQSFMTIGSRAIAALREGRALTGYFTPPGLAAEVPGVLGWSLENGARLDLIGDTSRWPQMESPHFVVHGSLRDGGDVSLLHAWVKTVAMTDQVTAVHSATLALGEHVDLASTWARAIYATANLSEWRRDSGLEYSPPASGTSPGHFRVEWRSPQRDEIRVPGAQLIFRGTRDTSISYSADWAITTWQDLVVDLDQPITLDEGWRRFASPLLNLMSFASDRPDGIVREILIDPEGNRRIEIWRQGQLIRPRAWEPVGGYLFHAQDLNDYADAITKWWTLDEQLRPALGLFADHIAHGRSYSPARFLTLYTAMEVYARDRHGRKDFRILRNYAEVAPEITGCTDSALALIGASRRYFAHLGLPPRGPTIDAIEANILASTRRASALMQACLLRELEFSPSEVEEILSGYYSRWSLS